ncbi:hypothetical protein KDAU_49530 [Dictyobacter aurantiacus]|uniref:Uncharacterized protein n=1 Tax=Dictyobacter aurantiacus TaxID=1936993 RepID=A0A401ZLC9_9CHLR|nr:hypothetical protein KDAU_49530 [Dictyobacter aurantiacus]
MVGAAPDLAKGDQVTWIKLELGIEMERFNVVHLQSLPPVTTDHAGRLAAKMLLSDSGPFRTAGHAILISDPGASVLLPGRDMSISLWDAFLFLVGGWMFAPGGVAAP